MLHPRIIPCLLVHQRGLVKTRQFKDPKYVGDPINAVRIFNEKEVDELTILDIDASVEKREPDFKMIENVAAECRMPLCYGGGVRTLEHAQRIFGLGVEKVALSSAAVESPDLVPRLADHVGNQSVVIVLDVRKSPDGRYVVCTHRGTKPSGKDPAAFARDMEARGAGEIVVNSIDNDGMMSGYDLALADSVREAVSLPLTFLGGAGSLNDIGALIARYGIVGAAAGSLFVFKGVHKAVLINYPARADKTALIDAGWNRFAGSRPA